MKLDSCRNLQIAFLIVTTLSDCWTNVLNTRTEKPALCLSTECVFSSANLLQRMNTDVDACENFYQFACGGFIRNTYLPDTASVTNTLEQLQGKVNVQLKRLFDKNIMRESPVRTFQLMKDFYLSCLDRKSSNSRGVKPVLDLIRRYGGWPVLSPHTFCVNCKYDWLSVMVQASNDGVQDVEIFSLNIMSDFKNTTRLLLAISGPSLGLNKVYLKKGFTDKKVQIYFNYMVDVAMMFGADEKTAVEKMTKVLHFEYELAKVSLPSVKKRRFKDVYNIYTIADLQKSYPYVQWLKFMRDSLGKNIAIDENEPIVNIDPNFFSQLSKILLKTSDETIANYLMWRLVMFSSSYLNDDLHRRRQIFDSSINGIASVSPFTSKCLWVTKKRMEIASSSLYIRTYFRNETKTAVEKIAKYIRAAFVKLLKQNKWMDEQTREAALNKANQMVGHIANPPELLNDDILDEYYKALKFERHDFFLNVLRLNIFNTEVVITDFRKFNDKNIWRKHSDMTTVNAYYSTDANTFTLKAAILQGHFFGINRPAYLNFADIGMVLGHEITHGFDDGGRQFDENGNLHDWWDKETSEKFLERSKCFINQYNNFIDSKSKLKLNGALTQGENIADNGGTKVAYLAYQQHVLDNGPDKILPGLQKYTANQLFWVSYAQTWCSVSRKEFNERTIMTSVHTLSEFRVLGVIQNSKYFEKDFSCTNRKNKIESNKCEIW